MNDVRPDLDLGGLSRQQSDLRPPRRGWLRIALPLGILLVFLAVLASSLGDLLDRGVLVRRVAPRHVQGTGGHGGAGQVLVQAAGWVEPDPFLVHVSALTGGVVREVLVQESDVLEPGDPVAHLIDDDARLARDRAQGELEVARGKLADAEARHGIAVERFEQAIEVTEALATARATHTGRVAEAEHRAAAVAGGEAQVQLAQDELLVQQELATHGAAGPRQVELAEGAVDAAESALAVLRADAALALSEVDTALAALTRAEQDLEHRFADRLEVERSAAAVIEAQGELARRSAALAEAELALDRTVVRTPVGGVVLERLTLPGMVLDVNTQGHEVCSIYDPASLRVRVDVPQDDLANLFVGQRAEVTTNARAEAYAGEVVRLVQLADIQKVTLEAQVRLQDGDALLRPDMLAQVRFFGGRSDGVQGTPDRLLVPRRLVDGDAVWVLDPGTGSATRRRVTLGQAEGDEVEVLEGLNVTDKLLDPGGNELTEGASVRFQEDLQ